MRKDVEERRESSREGGSLSCSVLGSPLNSQSLFFLSLSQSAHGTFYGSVPAAFLNPVVA
jgi:hypothetical protein